MNERSGRRSLLAEVECEALEEGREWIRKRIEMKLQRAVDKQGRFSPLKRSAALELSGDACGGDDERGEGGD
jgi:hypothetical protein